MVQSTLKLVERSIFQRPYHTCGFFSFCQVFLLPHHAVSQPLFRGVLGQGRGDGCGCDGPLSKQDEQSAVSMLKKHQILEQAVEDYAETVHQLSKTSRALVADNHPER